MQEVGRGRKAYEAAPVLGRVAVVEAGVAARPPEGGAGASEGIVALVAADAGPAALAPLEGSLAAIVCLGDGARAEDLVRRGRALAVPCVVGATFDGGPPASGSLVLVDCARADEGLVLLVDGGATDAADASVTERA